MLIFAFCISTIAQTPVEKTAIQKVAHSYINSWNNHDFSDLNTYTTREVTFINPEGMLMSGRTEVQKFFQELHTGTFKKTPIKILSEQMRMVSPTVAVLNMVAVVGTFYPPDGIDNGHNKIDSVKGYTSMIVVKRHGKWLLTASQVTDIER